MNHPRLSRFSMLLAGALATVAAGGPASGMPGPWESLGPYGIRRLDISGNDRGALESGRILDIERGLAGLRVAAATGGLWQYISPEPPAPGYWAPLSDNLNTLCISTFVSSPVNPDTIIVGTGEWGASIPGTGIWKTTDRGATWRSTPTPWVQGIQMIDNSPGIYRIRYGPHTRVVHAATVSGYYRSTDFGDTWTHTQVDSESIGDPVTDVAVVANLPNILYVTVAGHGLWRSTDSGLSWTHVTSGIPGSGNGRGAVAVSTGGGNVYALFANQQNALMGLYRSLTGGTTWTDVTPQQVGGGVFGFVSIQGQYDLVLGVSPTSPSTLIAGGVDMLWSPDAGTTWYSMSANPVSPNPYPQPNPQIHADSHAICWDSDGTGVWVGHDGGLSRSPDAGTVVAPTRPSWNTTINTLPITQYTRIDCGLNDLDSPGLGANLIGGGSQDNLFSTTPDAGATWYGNEEGDGDGFSVDPQDEFRLWATQAGSIKRSTDKGRTWSDITGGTPPAGAFPAHRVRNDQVSPVNLYCLGPNNRIYWLAAGTTQWAPLSSDLGGGDPYFFLIDLSVSRFAAPNAIVYTFSSSSQVGKRVFVWDTDGIWHERSAGLPAGMTVRSVVAHPTDRSIAYAIMAGKTNPDSTVYRSVDRGAHWSDVTGDLPNPSLESVLADPTDDATIYVGSDSGCFRTQDGTDLHPRWYRWNEGMPAAPLVYDLRLRDKRSTTGELFVLAGTYGRGIYQRDVRSSDPLVAAPIRKPTIALLQNRPNPFDHSTTIEFTMAEAANVQLEVFDVAGREVSTLVNAPMAAGPHRVRFERRGLSPGVYFCRLESGSVRETRRMIVF